MKHLSMALTVLLLGALPLAAAALDYGPDRTLLAAENDTPRSPGTQTGTAMPKPDAMEVDADEAADASFTSPRITPSTSRPPVTATSGGHGSTAGNKPHSAAPPGPAPEPGGHASWRSLLPGSIQ